ncbi:MAG: LuxR family transcriptional regulator [Altererythrobacter sp.]|nr:LuxR family transcriptional regulator [Altererythrobacter sp.]
MAQNRLDYRDALGLIANAETIVSFRRAIYEILKAIRFGGVYFLAPLVADRRVGRVFWNVGFPKSWEQSYRESGRLDDLLPNLALNRGSAFRWSEAENVGNVDERGLSYLSRLRTGGMGQGVATHCTGPYARSGFVGVGMPEDPDALDEADVRRIQMASQLCFLQYCHLVGAFKETVPELSQRELDFIRWIGEGKSNAVIAEILGITKNSVDSYVKRIFSKIDVSDRTAAAVRAVSLGLISPGKHFREAAHRPRWLA